MLTQAIDDGIFNPHCDEARIAKFIIDATGVVEAAAGSKSAIAHRIWDAVVAAGQEKK